MNFGGGLKNFEAKYLCFSKCGLINNKREIYDYFFDVDRRVFTFIGWII